MKKRLILSTVAMVALLNVGAQTNSPTAEGYLSRGAKMFDQSNYIACLDQLQHIDRATLGDDERQQLDWLIANATYGTSGAEKALVLFENFLVDYPQSLLREEAYMRVGDCLYAMSEYIKALDIYEDIDSRALTSDLRETLDYRAAYSHLQLGRKEQATRRFERLLSTKKYANAARLYLGYIDYLEGHYDTAVRHLNAVNTDVAPGNMADYYLCQIYFKGENYGKALSTARSLLRKSSEINKTYIAEANRIAGESLYKQGEISASIDYLNKHIEQTDTPAPTALYIVGLNEYNHGNYTKAVQLLEPVTKAPAGNETIVQSAYLYIGQALHKSGDKDAAMLAFDKALKSDTDPKVQEAAYYNYAVTKFAGGNIPFGSTVATFEEFLKRYPTGPYSKRVQEYIVSGYVADNNYEKALDGINKMQNPGRTVLAAKQQVLYTLGAKALAAGNANRAAAYLDEAAKLSKYNADVAAEVLLLSGEAYAAKGDNGTAVARLGEYLHTVDASAANRHIALYDLGYAQFALKNYEASEAAFTAALDAKQKMSTSSVADICNRLGDIRYYASRFNDAADWYDKAYVANKPDGDYALFQYALMKGYMRDYKTKLAKLKQLKAEFPSSSLMPDALLEMTESYIRLGRNEEAVETYRGLSSEYASTAQGRQGYLQMAMTLLNMGEKEQAIKAYKDVISLYPTSDEAAQASTLLKHLLVESGQADKYIEFMSSVDNAPEIDSEEVRMLALDNAQKVYETTGDISRIADFAAVTPGDRHTAVALGILMTDAGKRGNEDAFKYAEKILADYPDSPAAEGALELKAGREYDLGNGAEALATWQQLERKASTPERVNIARMGIMRVARDLGDDDLTIESADAILSSSTAGAEAKSEATFSRALAMANKGNNDEARLMWNSISGNTDDLYGAKSAFYLAENLAENGLTAEALTKTNEFINSGTPHSYWLARGFILLSDLYLAQGKTFEAKEYLEALRENYPGTESDIFIMIDSRLAPDATTNEEDEDEE